MGVEPGKLHQHLRKIGPQQAEEFVKIHSNFIVQLEDVNTVLGSEGEMLQGARRRMLGHLSYYAITDNLERCQIYDYYAQRILFKWLNRKSQRKAYTWAQFSDALAWVNWPTPRIRKDLYPCRRAEAD